MESAQRTQSYEHHAHHPALAYAAAIFGFLAAAASFVLLVTVPSLMTAALFSLAIAVLCLVSISRLYIVRLQDRIIRLEMRTRVAKLMPHRASDFDRLSKSQIVALRFASDAELPALMDRALAEHLTSNQIKRAVRDWQGDYYRT